MDLGLFHLMEHFILKEVDYSQEYGYSSRAKRHMKRKLNKELTPYLDKINELDEYDENYKYDNSQAKSDICLGIAYMCIIVTFYGSVMFMVTSYSNSQNICNKI